MEITDIHINANDPAKSVFFQNGVPRRTADYELTKIMDLLAKSQQVNRADFLIDSNGEFYRGRVNNAVDGTWYKLRRMPPKAGNLYELPSPMPSHIIKTLLSSAFYSGWIHICGGPGSGKTTTAGATVISRLEKFGGSAQTVEDPPEQPLNGWHGEGFCSQTWVSGDTVADWEESMRGVLRSQPSGAKLVLYVGEVRDKETARAMLRAASNGFLVVSTGFGSDAISGIDTFFQMLGPEFAGSLAAAMRVVVHQELDKARGLWRVHMLTSDGPNSRVASTIKAGKIAHLQGELNYQENQFAIGMLPFKE